MENSELKEQSRHSFRLWAEFRAFMRDRFSLEDDKASQDEVAANISKGTEFRGVNLWVLICATMVASLGLSLIHISEPTRLLFHLPAGECEQRIARTYHSDDLRRVDRLFRRYGRYRGAIAPGS